VLEYSPLHDGVWRSGCTIPRSLNLGTMWRWGVSFTLRPIYLRRKNPAVLWIGGWVSPRAGLDAVAKRRIPALPGIEPRLSSPRPSHYIDWAIQAPLTKRVQLAWGRLSWRRTQDAHSWVARAGSCWSSRRLPNSGVWTSRAEREASLVSACQGENQPLMVSILRS
jgi:hypothetical protein